MCAVGQFFDSTGDLSMVGLVLRYAHGAIVQRDVHSIRAPKYLRHQRYLRRLFHLIRLMDGREIYPKHVIATQSTQSTQLHVEVAGDLAQDPIHLDVFLELPISPGVRHGDELMTDVFETVCLPLEGQRLGSGVGQYSAKAYLSAGILQGIVSMRVWNA